MNLDYLDYTTTTFANGFAGRSPLIDGFMVQVCFTYILSTVPLSALVVYLWDKNAPDERRIRLLVGAAAIGLSGLVCTPNEEMPPGFWPIEQSALGQSVDFGSGILSTKR